MRLLGVKNTSHHPTSPVFLLRWPTEWQLGAGTQKIHPFIPHLVSTSITSVAVRSQLSADTALLGRLRAIPGLTISQLCVLSGLTFHICKWGLQQ